MVEKSGNTECNLLCIMQAIGYSIRYTYIYKVYKGAFYQVLLMVLMLSSLRHMEVAFFKVFYKLLS